MNRYFAITATLKSRTAIHIGSGRGSDTTDDLCRRDAQGNFLIPGTTISGVLRSIATRIAPRIFGEEGLCKALLPTKEDRADATRHYNDGEPCKCAVCNLFGEINPSEDEDIGRASRLFVAHAKTTNTQKRIRDGVGIERKSKTSARAAQAKFDLETLPRGVEFELRLELEEAGEADEKLLAAVLSEWQEERLWLGGRVARGLGAFELKDLRVVSRDLSDDDALVDFLKSDEPWISESVDQDWRETRLNEARQLLPNGIVATGAARSFVSLKFDLRFKDLFLTNDTVLSTLSGFDHAPLLEVMLNKESAAIVPGSSLRGVLRSQAERIARTLTTFETNSAEEFGRKCPACDPLQRPNKTEAQNRPLASCDSLLKNVLTDPADETKDEHLCLACLLFGSTRRGSRFIVEDAFSQEKLSNKVLDFLAIDRFTGGGKDGAKFDAVALWRPAFSVHLHLENPADWELGWLLLTLRDVADGLVPIGFGGAKGFGQAEIDNFKLGYGFIGDEDFTGPAAITQTKPEPTSGLYRVLAWETNFTSPNTEFLNVANDWVTEFNDKVKSFERKDARLQLKQDNYFDGEIPQLYSKEATV
jgi:CRISPR/Cas system CSM-associated protein Csm3 (group 7 of RAMP superfamily)